MKKLRVTSPHFRGNIDLVYNQIGMLCMIDAMNAEVTQGQFKKFLKISQPNIDDIGLWFNGTSAKITEVPLEATFEMFWTKYGKKINRARCVKLWDKLSPNDCMDAI